MKSNLKVISINRYNDTEKIFTKQGKDAFQLELIADWELQQKAKGYTEASIALNIRNVSEFLRKIDKYIWEITADDVDIFYAHLVGKNLAHSTRRKYQSNISTFIEYLKTRKARQIYEKLDTTIENVFDSFNKFFHRKDDNDIRVLPPKAELIELLYSHMKREMMEGNRYYTIARDYVFFKLLHLLGIRINELVMVNINDVRRDLGATQKGKLYVRYGKGSRGYGPKPRWIPLINHTDILLDWYIDEIYPHFKTSESYSKALFLSERGNRVQRDTMRSSLTRRQKKAGIPKEDIFSAHQLRHSFATMLTKEGVDILTLSKILGHSNISTTSAYIDPESDYIEKRIRISQQKWINDLMSLEDLE